MSAPLLRCPHRNYSDYLCHCETSSCLCQHCLVLHLNYHENCKHAICQDVKETLDVNVEILVRDGERWKMWKLTFSSVTLYAKFIEKVDIRVKIVNIVVGRNDSTSLFRPLMRFDNCSEISISDLKTDKEANIRFLAAWLHSQKHLLRLAFTQTKLPQCAFNYILPAVTPHRIRELTLSGVIFPEGGLGKLVRRVLNLGALQMLSLRYLDVSAADMHHFSRTLHQISLKEIEFCDVRVDRKAALSGFTSRLATVHTVHIESQSSACMKAIVLGLPGLQQLRKLTMICRKEEKIDYLPLILPALPHLRECSFNGNAMQALACLGTETRGD